MADSKADNKEGDSMIYDTLQHLEQYEGIHPGVYRGLQLLRDTDFSALEDQKQYEVDGRNLFFSLQTYQSKLDNDTPEAHRDYIDIQYLIEGQEKVGVAPLEDMTEEVEARAENDIWFYRGPVDQITLGGSRFAVFFPGDAHAPGIAVGQPECCRKCVVKVRVK